MGKRHRIPDTAVLRGKTHMVTWSNLEYFQQSRPDLAGKTETSDSGLGISYSALMMHVSRVSTGNAQILRTDEIEKATALLQERV